MGHTAFVLAMLFQSVLSQEFEPHPKSYLSRQVPVKLREGGQPQLTTNTSWVGGKVYSVEVTWHGVEYARNMDYIGMWPAGADLRIFSAPIKFIYARQNPYLCHNLLKERCVLEPLCEWRSYGCTDGRLPESGSVVFNVLNMRTDVVFFFISGSAEFPELIAQSKPVHVVSPNIPVGVHLALGDDPSSMRVYWQAGTVGSPGVKFGLQSGDYKYFAAGYAAPGRQFTQEDFCDKDSKPAGRQGYLNTGILLEATLEDLTPSETYYYIYGDDATGWSRERSFTAAPKPDPNRPTVIAAFGDLGQTEADGSHHHSWDFNNMGELPSMNTTLALGRDAEAEMILHIGDISYAVGYISEWATFFYQIEPVASRKPWMTSIGNHEQGYSGSFLPGTDSGGECGVTYNAYFPFASQDPFSKTPFSDRKPWYSFTYGSVKFIQMSTEHDYTTGSHQHTWIINTLKAIDRSITPWVVFSGHRPMYVAEHFAESISVAKQLREHVEPYLLEYEVDVGLWAHTHSYIRYCPLRNGTCVAEDAAQPGIRHYTIGMAGYEHSHCPSKSARESKYPHVVTCDDSKYGYVRMNFKNQTTLVMEYVNNEDNEIIETSVVVRRQVPRFQIVV